MAKIRFVKQITIRNIIKISFFIIISKMDGQNKKDDLLYKYE